MELDKLKLEEVRSDMEGIISAQEFDLIPAEYRKLIIELRTSNNYNRWLVARVVLVNNVVVDHGDEIQMWRNARKVSKWIIGSAGGIAALWAFIKFLIFARPPKP